MKITTKTTKEQLKSFLGANAQSIKAQDKDLYDRMVYASNMMKKDETKVQRKDLVDLAKEVIKALGDKVVEVMPTAPTPVVAENSTKKLSKGKKKEESVPASEEETAEEPAKEEVKEDKAEKKTAKKSSKVSKKKETPKKEGVTALEGTDKTVQLAKMFPKTLEVGEAKYELASDIKTMEDLYKALDGDEPQEIVFAFYWTKRHLRQFPYFGGMLGQPKSFDNDLDLASCIHVSDEFKVSYAVSMYTEAVYSIFPDDFKEEEGIRIAGGMEFQIYRAV